MKREHSKLYQAKTRVKTLAFPLLLLLLALFLTACGPQKEEVQKGALDYQKIYQQKTLYVGDASKVGNMTNLLYYNDYREGIALQTDAEPYGITVNYEMPEELAQKEVIPVTDEMLQNAALMFCLIDNVDQITFAFHEEQDINSIAFSREQFNVLFEKDIRVYGSSWEVFQNDFVSLLEQQEWREGFFDLQQ
ncbi:DUF4825 domain-containing protein [Heliorestis convoluta]|uniref:Putative lipoprotein n=1 Tax=Heliorestis convoluta TaxID=356322 RepID=A0A5Q2N549_9FIRM|nr:DUF4825 domain-containing protein [Heliorestis convoluta]QGG49431.1 putative lipoprotein [Heliorestis convoluta]